MSVDLLKGLQQKIKDAQDLLQIAQLKKKLETLSIEMNAPNFWVNPELAQAVSKDYQDIKDEVDNWENLGKKANDLVELEKTHDESLKIEITKQIQELSAEFAKQEFYLLLDGPYDKNNAIISIHAGAGGTEAQDWAEMLFRMIMKFCEKQSWQTKIIDESPGQEAGIKSITLAVAGRYAYGYLKSENGTHRLVRISPFDAEKMRHTSFASLEVLPEINETIEIKIEDKDLRIDTFNSSGAGGQSVNTTYSAVRIVHIPTNITVTCQNERSQIQNKETALKILKSKLYKLAEEKMMKEKQELKGEYKSAEWGNQIRSYVLHPYHLVKDHRSDYESTNPEAVLEGDLLPLSEAYLRWIKK